VLWNPYLREIETASPLESILTFLKDLKSIGINTYEKTGVGGKALYEFRRFFPAIQR